MVGKTSAKFDVATQDKTATVILEGIILLDQAKALRTFLDGVLTFPGNRWILRLENLKLISHRGMQALCDFAREIRKRGYEVEIAGIDPVVLEALKASRLLGYFSRSAS